MKKVLFLLQTMVLGGVEKELLTILKKFNKKEFDITVMVLYIQDENIVKEIPNSIHFVNLEIPSSYCGDLREYLRLCLSEHRYIELLDLVGKKIMKIGTTSANVSLGKLPDFKQKYDIAVCYHIHSPIALRFVIEKINAAKKMAWIHNDFSSTGYQIKKYQKWMVKYDRVISVSERLTDEFVEIFPNMRGRTFTAHNIVDDAQILKMSMDKSGIEKDYFEDNRFKILTIGRFVNEKGYDIAIKTCKLLRDKGVNVSWYAIGYGPLEYQMRTWIDENGATEDFIILGKKENPYVYLKDCNLYVQPSRSEGFGLVISEALLLGKPIVCTNFAGADEQIINGINGIIVNNCDEKELCDVIEKLIMNKSRLKEIEANIVLNENRENNWKTILQHFE